MVIADAEQVLCTDPDVRDPTLLPLDEVIHRSDVIILGVSHSAYRDLSFGPDKTVIDIWNFWSDRRELCAEAGEAQVS